MLFNSFQFIIFFPIVIGLYFMLPTIRLRVIMLLIASCYFYMVFVPYYILILAVTIVIDYIAGIYIEGAIGKRRKLYLVISILSNVGFLAFFKYFNFFNSNIEALADFLHWNYPISALNIILPVGLSFHTFQAMSYTIEVYRGHLKAERNFWVYSLYVMFFPQLVAGPIERATNLIHQFYNYYTYNYERISSGLRLMLWGMFKKVVIADRLAIYVNQVYGNVDNYSGLPLLFATVFFAFQIYTDFSGYSDIAIGSARVMGFSFMNNFNRPYLSRSIKEFWARWHISLSSWFRDYLYIPLGGNKVLKWRWYYNLFITFLISGLWHGANWTFVIWGAIHGSFLVLEIIFKRKQLSPDISFRIKYVFRIAFTFILVLLSWVFFRANSIHDAWYVLSNIWNVKGGGVIGVPVFSKLAFTECFIAVGIVLFSDIFSDTIGKYFKSRKSWLYFVVVVQLVAIYVFGIFEEQQFIYFQF